MHDEGEGSIKSERMSGLSLGQLGLSPFGTLRGAVGMGFGIVSRRAKKWRCLSLKV